MPLRCVEERRSPTQFDDEEEDPRDCTRPKTLIDSYEGHSESSKNRSPTQFDDDDGEEEEPRDCTCIWQETPDSILLHVFSFLQPEHLALVAQTCKKWRRVANDECLWKAILKSTLKEPDCVLAPGKPGWRSEVIRILYHTPTVLTETLQEHTDEVLHISFSHDGSLFSTTSKDATLKVWTVGEPTSLKYSKDFRELLGWDFTQFSCFNASDTMVLVSSVKTSGYMDRRGFMAILSLIHDFEILRVVTMDPSQLFGAWLDDTTFLGGSLEISLDRFATTVQIEAYDVAEVFSPLPRLSPTPIIEESSGKPMFTFSSETASLIKFLTVADILTDDTSHQSSRSPSSQGSSSDSVHLAELCPNTHRCRDDEPCSNYVGLRLSQADADFTDEAFSACSDNSDKFDEGTSSTLGERISEQLTVNPGGKDAGAEEFEETNDIDTDSIVLRNCDICKTRFKINKKSDKMCDRCREGMAHSQSSDLEPGTSRDGDSFIRDLQSCENKLDIMGADLDMILDSADSAFSLNKKLSKRPNKFDASFSERPDSRKNTKARKHYQDLLDITTPSSSTGASKKTSSKRQPVEKQKNLIFVTGEFAVALHQLGFKNMAPYTKESVLARGVTPMDEDNPEGFMVVNYSNNDIHIVRRQQETDKPDSLIDLFGHVTGLCLSADQRYLFINCRPWIGEVDRSDPWATPDLSPNIEVRIIDLLDLKDLGVRYVGHKGFSPSNMCCFVFLDVSQDYVASGSEDAKGYLWDRHYRSLLANYNHESGVVNAVGFNPRNQEYFVTVSDDGLVKVWRSKSEVKRLNLV